ncbi:hypothetical protein [Streptomyces inhibens]|uniref:hypothetical protein n=1 Tax=Streptomyces inhibens TaxID=2293571 RepID=UPI001FD0E3A3|nr:hypothetical protein [Streptomyces inhibens]
MPPAIDVRCIYLSDCGGTKRRWSLTADRRPPTADRRERERERDTLRQLAASCTDTDVEYEQV